LQVLKPDRQARMDRPNQWHELLLLATSVTTVREIMRDYVRALGPLVEALPPTCREALQQDTDIQEAAVALLHCEMRFQGSDEEREFLHELAHTFASAAVRITVLHTRSGSSVA
jgi:hypothetical protein